LEGTGQILLDSHHGPAVVELAAVVRSREYGDQLFFGEELVAILDDLMGSANEVELVFPQKGGYYVASEHVAHSSLGLSPHLYTGLRVCPQKIAQKPRIRNIGGSYYFVDLINRSQVRREAPVHAENFVLDQGSHRHTVEAVDEGLPKFHIVPVFA
jgi:hypothetical protein